LRKGDCAALTILNMQVTSTLLVAQAGGTQILMDCVDPGGVASWIRRESIGSWFGVPTLLHGLTHSEAVSVDDLESLTDVWTGGTYLAEPIRQAFERRFNKRVSATYGLTEVPTVVTIESHTEKSTPGSSGRVLPHLTLEVRADDGHVLPPNESGEITVRARRSLGQHVADARLSREDSASAATIRDRVLSSGRHRAPRQAGNLFVRDRRRSDPRAAQSILESSAYCQIAGVSGAAVVGFPTSGSERVAAESNKARWSTGDAAPHCSSESRVTIGTLALRALPRKRHGQGRPGQWNGGSRELPTGAGGTC
jgi:acyl-CoA synthetase (AMP-forming)/AMP-acid ligase II